MKFLAILAIALLVLFILFLSAVGIAFLYIISDLSNNEYEE